MGLRPNEIGSDPSIDNWHDPRLTQDAMSKLKNDYTMKLLESTLILKRLECSGKQTITRQRSVEDADFESNSSDSIRTAHSDNESSSDMESPQVGAKQGGSSHHHHPVVATKANNNNKLDVSMTQSTFTSLSSSTTPPSTTPNTTPRSSPVSWYRATKADRGVAGRKEVGIGEREPSFDSLYLMSSPLTSSFASPSTSSSTTTTPGHHQTGASASTQSTNNNNNTKDTPSPPIPILLQDNDELDFSNDDDEDDEDGLVTPKSVTRALIKHALKMTSNTRTFMEQNPRKRQPEDQRNYPGKMDHTTCISFRVGGHGAT